jgi:hypothetical protein
LSKTRCECAHGPEVDCDCPHHAHGDSNSGAPPCHLTKKKAAKHPDDRASSFRARCGSSAPQLVLFAMLFIDWEKPSPSVDVPALPVESILLQAAYRPHSPLRYPPRA